MFNHDDNDIDNRESSEELSAQRDASKKNLVVDKEVLW